MSIHNAPYAPYNDDVRTATAAQNVTDADGRVTSQSKATTRSLTWTSFDGVRTITDNGVTATYIYDAFGQIVRTDVDAATDSSIYRIPAGGGYDYAVYKRVGSGDVVPVEWTLFGMGRMGVSRDVASSKSGDVSYRRVGTKLYELTDHLGSVRALVPDIKLPSGGSYIVEPVSVYEYDAYGIARVTRTADLKEPYRYGFQGMLRMSEVAPSTTIINDYATLFRTYDARTGRWTSHDPLSAMFPGWSPYKAFLGNPLTFVDPLGTIEYFTQTGERIGSDGNDDGRYFIVGDPRDVALIRENHGSGIIGFFTRLFGGGTTSLNELQGAKFELPPYAVRQHMLTVAQRMKQPANIGSPGEDPSGKFHEEGFWAGFNAKKELVIVDFVPGPYSLPSQGNSIDGAQIQQPQSMASITKMSYHVHVHPTGTEWRLFTDAAGTEVYGGTAGDAPPSIQDVRSIPGLRSAFPTIDNNTSFLVVSPALDPTDRLSPIAPNGSQSMMPTAYRSADIAYVYGPNGTNLQNQTYIISFPLHMLLSLPPSSSEPALATPLSPP